MKLYVRLWSLAVIDLYTRERLCCLWCKRYKAGFAVFIIESDCLLCEEGAEAEETVNNRQAA